LAKLGLQEDRSRVGKVGKGESGEASWIEKLLLVNGFGVSSRQELSIISGFEAAERKANGAWWRVTRQIR
jgi:hypothetical protein